MRARAVGLSMGVLSAGAAVFVYAPTWRFGFVWDDVRVVTEAVPAITGVRSLFFPPHWVGDFRHYYRPISYALFSLVHALGGAQPSAWHAAAITLHALCAALAGGLTFALLAGSSRRWQGALAGGLLFAVHPVHVEAVAWVGSLTEATAALFLLLALLAYVRAALDGGRRATAGAVLCGACAMLSKETAVVLPLLALAMEGVLSGLQTSDLGLSGLQTSDFGLREQLKFVRSPKSEARGLRDVALRLGGLLGVLAIYILLRRVALEGWLQAPLSDPVVPRGIPAAVAAAGYYLQSLVLPWSSCHFVALPPPLGAGAAVLAVVLVGGLGLWMVSIWRPVAHVRERGRTARVPLLIKEGPGEVDVGGSQPPVVPLGKGDGSWAVAGFGLAWIVIALLPALALAMYPVATAAVAERYAYVPSIGLSLVVGGLVAAPRVGAWAARLCAVVLLIGAVATWTRLAPFENDQAFWKAAAVCAPGHCLPAGELADEDLRRGAGDEAERRYLAALQLECTPPLQGLLRAHIGVARFQQARFDEAEAVLQEAQRTAPSYVVIPTMLARCAIARANQQIAAGHQEEARPDLERARTALRRALELNPRDAELHVLSGSVAYNLGADGEARDHRTTALALQPSGLSAASARALLKRLGEAARPGG